MKLVFTPMDNRRLTETKKRHRCDGNGIAAKRCFLYIILERESKSNNDNHILVPIRKTRHCYSSTKRVLIPKLFNPLLDTVYCYNLLAEVLSI